MLQCMMHSRPLGLPDHLVTARTRLLPLLLSGLFLTAGAVAGELEFNEDDTVVVTAQRAWEAEAPDVVHFSGSFLMQAPDWSLAGETAVVEGKLDNPDKVTVDGNPARISFLREDDAQRDGAVEEQRIDGSADSVEYFRATDKLRMRGSATLTRKGNTLTGDFIEYDVETDRYSAGGDGGINVQIDPEDD